MAEDDDRDEKKAPPDEPNDESDEQKDSGKEESDEKESNDDGGEDKKRSLVPVLVAVVLLAAFVGYVLYEIYRPRPDVWTDDAYVRVHYTMLAPRISGKVASVPARDNAAVRPATCW